MDQRISLSNQRTSDQSIREYADVSGFIRQALAHLIGDTSPIPHTKLDPSKSDPLSFFLNVGADFVKMGVGKT